MIMKEKSPAFQFYPQDYIASAKVAEMSLEEEGAYIRLICYCWTAGSIPADPERCARLVGKGCSVSVATAVQRAFNESPTDPQRLVHERVEKEREKQLLHRQNASKAGQKSAALRLQKHVTAGVSASESTTSNGRSTGVQRKVNSSSSSSDEDVLKNDVSCSAVQFEDFWKVYPRKLNKQGALKAWSRATKKTDPQIVVDGAKVYADLCVGKEPEFIAHAATWLNQSRWTDEPESKPAEKTLRQRQSECLQYQRELVRQERAGEITLEEFNRKCLELRAKAEAEQAELDRKAGKR
jgi:uncharacterized protein YdaU (DUF1376 family)